MSDHILHYTGNRSPALLDTITSDGVAVNLTGATAKFQMRLVGSTTLKVDTAATILAPAAGTVEYDWAAANVDTPGFYTGWWHITLSGGTLQDTPEFLVEIRAHGPVTQEYASVEEVKDSLSLAGQSFADADIAVAIGAASRAIDDICDRRFYLDAANVSRSFVPNSTGWCMIDDLTSVTSVTMQGAVWTQNINYFFEPLNAPAQGAPWTALRAFGSPFLYTEKDIQPGWAGIDPRVVIVGKWGWPSVPPEIVQATRILSTRLMRRSREAAFGVLGLGEGAAIEIARYDADVDMLLSAYVRPVT